MTRAVCGYLTSNRDGANLRNKIVKRVYIACKNMQNNEKDMYTQRRRDGLRAIPCVVLISMKYNATPLTRPANESMR